MRYIATFALSLCIAFSALADDKIKIGPLPLKGGCVMVVEEYLSKARLGEKVMVVSDYCDVFSFNSGTVSKVLDIDGKYSVFVKSGNRYFVYNELKELAVSEGERLQKGDFIGELKYNSRYNEHQLEMQIWHDNGRDTRRLCNDEVVCVLRGVEYTPPAKKPIAKHTSKKKPVAKNLPASAKKKTYASTSKKSTANKKVAAKKTSSKSKKTTAAKKSPAKKKAPVKKAAAKKRK